MSASDAHLYTLLVARLARTKEFLKKVPEFLHYIEESNLNDGSTSILNLLSSLREFRDEKHRDGTFLQRDQSGENSTRQQQAAESSAHTLFKESTVPDGSIARLLSETTLLDEVSLNENDAGNSSSVLIPTTTAEIATTTIEELFQVGKNFETADTQLPTTLPITTTTTSPRIAKSTTIVRATSSPIMLSTNLNDLPSSSTLPSFVLDGNWSFDFSPNISSNNNREKETPIGELRPKQKLQNERALTLLNSVGDRREREKSSRNRMQHQSEANSPQPLEIRHLAPNGVEHRTIASSNNINSTKNRVSLPNQAEGIALIPLEQATKHLLSTQIGEGNTSRSSQAFAVLNRPVSRMIVDEATDKQRARGTTADRPNVNQSSNSVQRTVPRQIPSKRREEIIGESNHHTHTTQKPFGQGSRIKKRYQLNYRGSVSAGNSNENPGMRSTNNRRKLPLRRQIHNRSEQQDWSKESSNGTTTLNTHLLEKLQEEIQNFVRRQSLYRSGTLDKSSGSPLNLFDFITQRKDNVFS